jgi:hypothetical protein
MAQVYSQSYGYNFYFQVIKKASLNLTNLDLGGIGVGKFMDITTLLSNSALVFKTGTGSTLKVIAGGTKTITKAAIASNEGILTFGAAHGFANGATIVVAGLPSPFAALNGTRVITAVTTTSPFTLKFAFTATNETEATVNAGTASGAVLALDGTDNPIRLLGLMNAAPSESEGEETIITYDDEAKSFDTSVATSKSFSWSLEGVTDHSDAAYKLMRIAAKESVREGLMVKYARRGPTGFDETTFGYGRFTGFEEQVQAGSIVKYSTTLRAYGPYELEF